MAAFVTACAAWGAKNGCPLPNESDDLLQEWRERHRTLEELLDHPVEPAIDGEQALYVRVGVPPILADRFQVRRQTLELVEPVPQAQTTARTQVLFGAGGVGKTQLAADYATQHWADPRIAVAVWISANSRQMIQAGYARAAAQVAGADESDPAQAASQFLAWLASTDLPWLVVLDDLERPEDLYELWPPTTVNGHVIVTTRRRDPSLFRQGRKMIEVGVFTPDESLAYLRAKLVDYSDLTEGAAGLIEDLGNLPLALAQAAAYLTNRNLTCLQYSERFADRRRTLAQLFPDLGELPDGHPRTIATTWSLSIELANTLSPIGVAAPLLAITSLLAPAGIPGAIFGTEAVVNYLSGSLGRDLTQDDTRDGLWCLHRLNLLTVEQAQVATAVQVHALVQRATRESLMAVERADIAYAAADALQEAWPRIERDTSAAYAFRNNADALYAHAEKALWDPSGHPILWRAGNSLGEAGMVKAAIIHFERLYNSANLHLGSDHPDTFTIRRRLAYWRGESGDASNAASALAELVADQAQSIGSDHPDTLTTRNYLANWLGWSGRPSDAAAVMEQLLVDQVRVLGPDHPDTLRSRNNIANWQGHAGGRPDVVVVALTDLLADQVRTLGPDDPDTLTTRNDLANWRGAAGDLAGAVAAAAQVLADRERMLGPDHPDTLTTRSNLAGWQEHTSDPAGSAAARAELLEDQIRVLGPDHPDTLITRGNLSFHIAASGDLTGAVDLAKQVLFDGLRVLGPDHPQTFKARNVLIHHLVAAGDPVAAAGETNQLLANQRRVLGANHPDVLVTRAQIAYQLSEIGDLASAINVAEELLTDQVRELGADHHDTLLNRGKLANWRGQTGDVTGAINEFMNLLVDFECALGPDHPDTLTTQGHLANWMGESGNLEAAVARHEKLLTHRLRVFGPNHPQTHASHNNTAYWRQRAKKANQADPGPSTC